jgi:hypothetical protein
LADAEAVRVRALEQATAEKHRLEELHLKAEQEKMEAIRKISEENTRREEEQKILADAEAVRVRALARDTAEKHRLEELNLKAEQEKIKALADKDRVITENNTKEELIFIAQNKNQVIADKKNAQEVQIQGINQIIIDLQDQIEQKDQIIKSQEDQTDLLISDLNEYKSMMRDSFGKQVQENKEIIEELKKDSKSENDSSIEDHQDDDEETIVT